MLNYVRWFVCLISFVAQYSNQYWTRSTGSKAPAHGVLLNSNLQYYEREHASPSCLLFLRACPVPLCSRVPMPIWESDPHINHHQLLRNYHDYEAMIINCWLYVPCPCLVKFHFLVYRLNRRIRLIHVGIFNIWCAQRLSAPRKKKKTPIQSISIKRRYSARLRGSSYDLRPEWNFIYWAIACVGTTWVIPEDGILVLHITYLIGWCIDVNRPRVTLSLNRDSGANVVHTTRMRVEVARKSSDEIILMNYIL